MAGKPRPMSQIKQMIRLHKQGYAIKSIARSLGISKNTVKSYLYKIGEARLDMEELLAVDDPVLEGLLHSGNPAYRDPRYEYLKERLRYFEEELDKVGVTRKLLWEEYRISCPVYLCNSAEQCILKLSTFIPYPINQCFTQKNKRRTRFILPICRSC